MTDTKVSLRIIIPGGVMYSKHLCFENRESVDADGNAVTVEEPIAGMTDKYTFHLASHDRKTGKTVNERFDYHVRKCVPAKRLLNICTDAYNDMVDGSKCPQWFRAPGLPKGANAKAWSRLSDIERLEAHLDAIAANFNGVVEGYEILDDDEVNDD